MMDHLLLQSRASARCSLWEPGGALTKCFLEELNSSISIHVHIPHIATDSPFSSSLDFVPSTLGYGFSRAGWCPHPLVPASSPTGVPALTLARFTHLLHNLENHFPNCGLLTVYNIGIWLECHFRKGDMDPFRKSVASESAHTLSGMCSVLPFLPSAGRI